LSGSRDDLNYQLDPVGPTPGRCPNKDFDIYDVFMMEIHDDKSKIQIKTCPSL